MRGRMKGLEAHHRLDDPLDETMILTDDVVQVFDLPDFYCAAALSEFQDRVHSFRPVRRAVRDDCALEELPRQGFKERRLWSGSLGSFLRQLGSDAGVEDRPLDQVGDMLVVKQRFRGAFAIPRRADKDRAEVDLQQELRWREWMGRIEAMLFARASPVGGKDVERGVGQGAALNATSATSILVTVHPCFASQIASSPRPRDGRVFWAQCGSQKSCDGFDDLSVIVGSACCDRLTLQGREPML